MLTGNALRAIATATIDVAFLTVADAVATGRLRAALLSAHTGLAIRTDAAAPPNWASLAAAATTIDVGFAAGLVLIVAALGLAGTSDAFTVSAVAHRVAMLSERARQARAATVDVRFAFVLELVLAVWRPRGRAVDELEFRRAAGSHQ